MSIFKCALISLVVFAIVLAVVRILGLSEFDKGYYSGSALQFMFWLLMWNRDIKNKSELK